MNFCFHNNLSSFFVVHLTIFYVIEGMAGFISCWLVLIFTLYVQSLYKSDEFRSSYLSVWEDHSLLGHVTVVKTTRGITSCTQSCFSMSGCLSFNFGKDSNRCELNNSSSPSLNHQGDLTIRRGFVYGHWISIPLMKFVFTTLGAQGPMGPKNISGYLGTSLEGQVQLKNGIQKWDVPYTGTYFIEAFGASGSNGTCSRSGCSGWKQGGLGAKIAGSFELQCGQKLKILVGQQGEINFDFPTNPGGGGGGTFVTLMDNSPLIIAGGGGGGSIPIAGNLDGDPGQAGQSGTRSGGTGGSGAKSSFGGVFSGTGAGLWGDGEGMDAKALSFTNGGYGADATSRGGFGGGGYGMSLPGGGGGYSGGGVEGTNEVGTAGGGGSINNGTSQINESGVNKGDGKVIITLMT